MSVTSCAQPGGYQNLTLTHGSDEVVISAFGAQILSWTRDGVPIIYDNHDHAIIDGKTPYRGGAPICFAFFGKGSLLPLGTVLDGQHGLARVTVWETTVLEGENGVALTTTQPSAEGYGLTEFACKLAYTLDEGLTIRATIQNVGGHPSPFQFVVHTYWAAEEPSMARVKGLGNRYLDNLLGLTEHTEPDSSQPHPTPYDRVYLDAETRQELVAERHRIEIVTHGCAGSVLWNPGLNNPIKDLGAPNFVCLESGVVSPSINLLPGQEHVIEIAYQVQAV